jgi:aryl-alcohol dehydrogenase-like predicted oxidoreductase
LEYVRLGGTGLKVSRVCLGMMTYGDPAKRPWALDETGAAPIVARAAGLGVTFFDMADSGPRLGKSRLREPSLSAESANGGT